MIRYLLRKIPLGVMCMGETYFTSMDSLTSPLLSRIRIIDSQEENPADDTGIGSRKLTKNGSPEPMRPITALNPAF